MEFLFQMRYCTEFRQYLSNRLVRLQATGLEGQGMDRFLRQPPEWSDLDIRTLESSLRALRQATGTLGFGEYLEGDRRKHILVLKSHLFLVNSLAAAFIQGSLGEVWDRYNDRMMVVNLAHAVICLCHSGKDIPKFTFFGELFFNLGVVDIRFLAPKMLEMNYNLRPDSPNSFALMDMFNKMSRLELAGSTALRPATDA